MKPKPKPSLDKNQSAKFKQAARELGCDEDEAAFEKRLRKIAKIQMPKEGKSAPAPKKRTT